MIRQTPLRVSWILAVAAPALAGLEPAEKVPRPEDPRPAAPPADAVERAVERGRKDLRGRLRKNLERRFEDYPLGRVAFPLAALLKAGEPADSELVARALKTLEGMPIEKTYCAATYLFALDAYLEKAPGDPGSARKRLAGAVAHLVESQSSAHGSWTYGKEPGKDARHDFSNTQFAALGLAIGRKHGVDVPRGVFTRLAALFGESITLQGPPGEHEIARVLSLEEKLRTSRQPPLRVRSEPGGWGYRDPKRSARRQKAKKAPAADPDDGEAFGNAPYASMTAAGASSLIIALDALRSPAPPGRRAAPESPPVRKKGTAPERPLDEGAVIARAERALLASFAWISTRFDAYVSDGRHLFYTLYSLEKVGDLGRIERFGGRDWYAEGASLLLRKERPGGGWGSYVETSFALLFLVRATSALHARAAPAVYTGAGKDSSGRSDLVYIAKLNGFLSAGAILDYMGETRNPELVPLGEEVVDHYAPDAREDLAPGLLRLWTKPDTVTSFARKALAAVTGLEAPDRASCESFVEDLEAVKRLEEKADVSAEELGSLLTRARSPRLKSRIVSLARKRDLRALTGKLVDEMAQPSAEYREKVHGILTLWTAQTIPPARPGDARGWDAVAEAWRVWWSRSGATQDG